MLRVSDSSLHNGLQTEDPIHILSYKFIMSWCKQMLNSTMCNISNRQIMHTQTFSFFLLWQKWVKNILVQIYYLQSSVFNPDGIFINKISATKQRSCKPLERRTEGIFSFKERKQKEKKYCICELLGCSKWGLCY